MKKKIIYSGFDMFSACFLEKYSSFWLLICSELAKPLWYEFDEGSSWYELVNEEDDLLFDNEL